MDINEEEEIKKEFQLERVILFTDAVFAIILTIMVLDIKLPENFKSPEVGGMQHAIKLLIMRVIGYLVTFVLVARFWMIHLKLFRYLKDYDRNLIMLNLAFLFSVTLFPFAISTLFTELPGEQMNHWSHATIQSAWSLQIYITVALLTFFIQALVARYLLRNRDQLCVPTANLENELEWKVTQKILFMAPGFLLILFLLNFLPLPYYTPFIIVSLFGFITGKLKQRYYPQPNYAEPVIARLYNYAKNNRFRRPTHQNTIKKKHQEQEEQNED